MANLKSISGTNPTDVELIESYSLKQHQDILAILYLRYTNLVYGTSVKYLKDQDLAKDAVMDIYQELLEKLKTNKVDNFKSWLYVLVKNHCLMKLRKVKNIHFSVIEPELMQTSDSLHLEAVMQNEKQLDKLHVCLGQLQVEQQKVVSMFYLENRCYNEITDLTGYDWNRVRSLIQNGKRNLKICLEKNVN